MKVLSVVICILGFSGLGMIILGNVLNMPVDPRHTESIIIVSLVLLVLSGIAYVLYRLIPDPINLKNVVFPN